MTDQAIQQLIVSAESSGGKGFWEYEGQFFMLFYNRFKNTPFADIPDIAFMYMEMNNWQGMSVRCGVWQYYESGAFQKGKFERVLSFLRASGEEKMADAYAYGIHDYANERIYHSLFILSFCTISYGFTHVFLPYKGKKKGSRIQTGEYQMEYKELFITNIPAISAVYFALLQCKYNFYPIERDTLLVDKLQSFILSDCGEYDFFFDVKQNTCEVYPYWPRAAMLETATFYIDFPQGQFVDFNAYKNSIMSAKNISDMERNQLFWDWIMKFPEALKPVLQSNRFRRYLEWENGWIADQNQKHREELGRIRDILALCREKFKSPIQNIQVILNPIKCVYSADYHLKDNNFIFCSGSLREESVIHEFIHHIVHPVVENRKDEILCCNFTGLDVDASYYLNHDAAGKLNAFEEYMVRLLTAAIVNGNIPETLEVFFDQEINKCERRKFSRLSNDRNTPGT